MFVIFNKDGSIFAKTQSDYVMQGSNRVNKVFVGFVDNDYADWTCNGVFNLPNGTRWTIPAIYVAGGFQYLGTTYFGWQIELTDDITKYFGNVELSIQIVNSQTSILYTYLTNITVNRTGFPIDGSWDASINVAQLNDYMAQLATKLQANTVSVAIRESDLPSTGEKNVLYFVIGATSNEPYQVKMWNGSEYTLLGTVNLSTYANQEDISQLRNEIANPFTVVDTIGDLPSTDQNRLYIVVATGKWYYWNGTEYAEGGQFINVNEASNIENGQGENSIQQKGNYAVGDNSFATGIDTQAEGTGSFTTGDSTIARGDFQAVFGTYNIPKNNDVLLIIGNGTDFFGGQSNAFEVYKDGHAEVQKVGTTDNSVITKGYVDPQILEIKNALYGSILAVENQNYINVGWGIFDRANGYPIVSNQKAQITSVKGRTLIANQLVKNGNFATNEEWKITSTEATATWGTKKLTITTMRAGGNWTAIYQYINGLRLNDKYYLKIKHTKSSNCALRLRYPQILTISDDIEYIITANEISEGSLFFQAQSTDGQEATLELTEIEFTNLTKEFGAGREPTTVAEYNNLTHNLLSSSFDTGSITPTNFFQINKKGFNKFDGVLEIGAISGQGVNSTNANVIRTKNYIEVICGETYSLNTDLPTPSGVFIYEYDRNQNFISFKSSNTKTFSVSGNTFYVRLTIPQGTTVGIIPQNKTCLHLGQQSGVYKPYNTEIVNVFDIDHIPTLQGIGTAQDEKTLTQDIKIIGMVDLGSLDWTYYNEAGHEYMLSSALTNIKKPSANAVANILCVNYDRESQDNVYLHRKDNIIAVRGNGGIYIYSTTQGTDTTAFKNSLNGIILYYELETPITLTKDYAKKVDLGSLNWTYDSTNKFFSTQINDIVVPTSASLIGNYLIDGFTNGTQNDIQTNTSEDKMFFVTVSKYIGIRDLRYTDAATFKQAMSGIYLYYETTEKVSTPLPEIGLGEIIIDNVERLGTFDINGECIADFEIASVVYKPIGE